MSVNTTKYFVTVGETKHKPSQTNKILITLGLAIGNIILTYLLHGARVRQEIPHISRNPKFHYRTHKRPSPVSILGQPNPVHIPTSHLLEIHLNSIHPSTPRSPQWSLSLRFPQQDPTHPSLLTHTRHMPSPSHFSRLFCRLTLYKYYHSARYKKHKM